jgi:hypothetical protein
MADILYKRWGVKSKVYFTLLLGVGQGVFSIAMGFYVQKTSDPSLAGIMIFIVIQAFFNEMANGANYGASSRIWGAPSVWPSLTFPPIASLSSALVCVQSRT